MPEVNITGPAGRLEARYHHNPEPNAPIAMILHAHPQFGGTMNNPIVYHMYYMFLARGFSVLRFNFRGVGRSQGLFDNGPGELSDAASALDWVQGHNPDARFCFIAGAQFGSWIAMQLLMRRPEIQGFISVAAPANLYDYSFLAPCPSPGLMITGENDKVSPPQSVRELVDKKVKTQKGVKIDVQSVPGANHFFDDNIDTLLEYLNFYLDARLAELMPAPALSVDDEILAALEAPLEDGAEAAGEEFDPAAG
ncbi:MAG: alpha/beta hydrolase [Pseudomonadota bacterium]